MSKGYGFVKFTNSEESNKAIMQMRGHMIRGKPIKTSQSHSRSIQDMTYLAAKVQEMFPDADDQKL